MFVQTNDSLVVVYISSLIRSILALHNLIENKVSNRYARVQCVGVRLTLDTVRRAAELDAEHPEVKERERKKKADEEKKRKDEAERKAKEEEDKKTKMAKTKKGGKKPGGSRCVPSSRVLTCISAAKPAPPKK
jgi:26S proteasome regulatory subunit N8